MELPNDRVGPVLEVTPPLATPDAAVGAGLLLKAPKGDAEVELEGTVLPEAGTGRDPVDEPKPAKVSGAPETTPAAFPDKRLRMELIGACLYDAEEGSDRREIGTEEGEEEIERQ